MIWLRTSNARPTPGREMIRKWSIFIGWTFLLLHVVDSLYLESSSSKSFLTRRNRVAVDYAPRLIGLAYSDILGQVHPHSTFKNQPNQIFVAQHILNFAMQKSAIEVILGIPIDRNGELSYDVQNFNGRLCLKFSRVLSAISKYQYDNKIAIKLFDERYSTREAGLKRDNGVFGSKDSVAAACILERYMEDEGVGSLDAIPCDFPIPPEFVMFDYQSVRDYVRSSIESKENTYHFMSKKNTKHLQQHSPMHNKNVFKRKKKGH